MTKLKIFNNQKSNKKYKLGNALCAAGIVMALLPVPAFASEPQINEKSQIEVTSDVNLGLNPFYEPTEEDLIFDISVLQNNGDSYLEFQQEISFEEYEEILANSEDTVIFAKNGKVLEIDKQEFQNAIQKVIDSYNQSDKFLTDRIKMGVMECVSVVLIGFVTLIIVATVQEKRKEKKAENQLVKEKTHH